MSSLFQTISKVHPTLPGWCPPEKAEALAAMVVALRPRVSVEIGIYGGSSFIPIALAHKENGNGIALGIDPWSEQASVAGEAPEHVAWWGKQNHEQIYQGFMAAINRLELQPFIKIARQTSDAAVAPAVIDLLHIDGNHTEQAVRDVAHFATRVRAGGLCVMDDLNWGSGGVKRAETRLLALGFKLLYALGTGAVYQRG